MTTPHSYPWNWDRSHGCKWHKYSLSTHSKSPSFAVFCCSSWQRWWCNLECSAESWESSGPSPDVKTLKLSRSVQGDIQMFLPAAVPNGTLLFWGKQKPSFPLRVTVSCLQQYGDICFSCYSLVTKNLKCEGISWKLKFSETLIVSSLSHLRENTFKPIKFRLGPASDSAGEVTWGQTWQPMLAPWTHTVEEEHQIQQVILYHPQAFHSTVCSQSFHLWHTK